MGSFLHKFLHTDAMDVGRFAVGSEVDQQGLKIYRRFLKRNKYP